MNPLTQIKIPHHAIPVSEWNDRIDPGVTRPKLRPMKSISYRHPTVSSITTSVAASNQQNDPWSLTEAQSSDRTEDSDTRFSNWLEELQPSETDITSPVDLQPEAGAISDNAALVDPTAAEPPPPAPSHPPMPPTSRPTDPANVSTISENEPAITPIFHSVNHPQHRLETAYFHLRTMGLPSDASWSQIRSRYRQINELLSQIRPSNTSEEVDLIARRRSVNVAYACLRILSSHS